MAGIILKRDAETYRRRAAKFNLSPETIAVCCGETAETIQSILDGRMEPPLHFRVFFSLYGGTSADSRNATLRAVKAAAAITSETEWRQIPGYERYEASNLGQIRRARRRDGRPDGLILKPYLTSTGHSNVSVYDEVGKQHRSGVHRLIALAFHGHPKPPHTLVRHLNGDPTDNHKDNLKWGTFEENIEDMLHHSKNGKPGEFPGNLASDPHFELKVRQKRKMLQRLTRMRVNAE